MSRVRRLRTFDRTFCLTVNLTSTGTGTGTFAYTWGADGTLASVTPNGASTVTATYDALGRVVETGSGSGHTQFVYDPLGEKLAVMNGQTLSRARVPLPGGEVAVYGPGPGLLHYWHADGLGTVRLATNPDQTLFADMAVGPYGEEYPFPATFPNFTGQMQDTVSGLYDFEFRRYEPVSGRWLSPDPAGLAAVDLTNPQSLNRYAYVMNNPLSLTDPMGLQGNCQQSNSCPPGYHLPSCTDRDCADNPANYCGLLYCGWNNPVSGYDPFALQSVPVVTVASIFVPGHAGIQCTDVSTVEWGGDQGDVLVGGSISSTATLNASSGGWVDIPQYLGSAFEWAPSAGAFVPGLAPGANGLLQAAKAATRRPTPTPQRPLIPGPDPRQDPVDALKVDTWWVRTVNAFGNLWGIMLSGRQLISLPVVILSPCAWSPSAMNSPMCGQASWQTEEQ